jgi:hypothetical protein
MMQTKVVNGMKFILFSTLRQLRIDIHYPRISLLKMQGEFCCKDKRRSNENSLFYLCIYFLVHNHFEKPVPQHSLFDFF